MESKYDYVVFDIETTGLHPDSDQICEIAAIGVKDGLPQGLFSTLVAIEGSMPEAAGRVNGITDDMLKVNALAIGAVFLVLLMLMKSISLPVILVLSIETAIWLNLAVPYFQGNTVFYISYLIISSVQLGATVDYAILLTDRYRECRQTMDKKESIVETISAVTVSILTSGSVMTVVGFLMGYISTHGLLAQLGKFLGIGTIFSMLIVLFVLPGMLYLLDRIFIGRKAHHHQNKKKKNQKEKQEVAVQ